MSDTLGNAGVGNANESPDVLSQRLALEAQHERERTDLTTTHADALDKMTARQDAAIAGPPPAAPAATPAPAQAGGGDNGGTDGGEGGAAGNDGSGTAAAAAGNAAAADAAASGNDGSSGVW